MKNLVIIGGGVAGLVAALTAKRKNRKINTTLITAVDFSYSPCAIPFVINGEIEDFDKIILDMPGMCKESEINLVHDRAISIDTGKKSVTTKNGEFPYDSLIIATGGLPIIPPLPGIELDGVYPIHRLEHGKKVLERIDTGTVKSAVVVGGGAIGVEIAAALMEKGLKVTLVELMEDLMIKCSDSDFCKIIENRLIEEGIELIMGCGVEEILGKNRVEGVRVGEKEIPADMVILGVGVMSDTKLAESAGITVNRGILTNGWMQTNIKDVYAAGDCICSRCLVTGRPIPSQLGTTAIRQGMVAATNAVGGYETMEGVLNSMVLKILDLHVGRTGLTEMEAMECGMNITVGRIKAETKAEYYPGGKEIHVKLIFNSVNQEIIGAQIIGGEMVAEKIDLIALAISQNAKIEDLMKLEYCYTPPLAPSHNPVVLAAENAFKKLERGKEVRRRKFGL